MLQSMVFQNVHHQHFSPAFFWILPPFLNLPLDHTAITILNHHSSINVTTFPTIWPQTSDHRLLLFGAFFQWSSHVKRVITQKTMKNNWVQMREGSYCLNALSFSVFPSSFLLSDFPQYKESRNTPHSKRWHFTENKCLNLILFVVRNHSD